MEPPVRIELTTYRLQGGCSTTELRRRAAPSCQAAQGRGLRSPAKRSRHPRGRLGRRKIRQGDQLPRPLRAEQIREQDSVLLVHVVRIGRRGEVYR